MSKQGKTGVGAMAREGYETKAGVEAVSRAGHCPQLKGHVHEILFKDRYNLDPVNILEGKTAELTKSATAPMKDVVMKQGGRVVGHAQLKDTVSSSGVKKTVEQLKAGHYNKTRVFGTTETADKVARAAARTGEKVQKVHSSGISSETTSRIAGKALGKMPTLGALGSAAKSGGASGAVVSAGLEAVTSVVDVCEGRKSVGEAAGDVTVAAIKGGAIGAASAAVSSVAAGATGAALTSAAATGVGAAVTGTAVGAAAVVFAPAVLGFGAACVVGGWISDLFD